MGSDKVALIVENKSERAAIMYQRMPDKIRNSIIWATNVTEGISVLKEYKERLFLVCMEHDLTDVPYLDSRKEDSGMEIVRWLEKQDAKEYKDCVFVIHSWNEIASPKMVGRLCKAGYNAHHRPFGLGKWL